MPEMLITLVTFLSVSLIKMIPPSIVDNPKLFCIEFKNESVIDFRSYATPTHLFRTKGEITE